jgi:hypothetical protein
MVQQRRLPSIRDPRQRVPRLRRGAVWRVAVVVLVAACLTGGTHRAWGDDRGTVAAWPEAQAQALAMSRRIDALLQEVWQAAAVEPAPITSDAEFLRRASLDLAGTLPRVSQVRAFLSDTSPQKRQVLVEKLLNSPRHAPHMARVWLDALLPQDGNEEVPAQERALLYDWLRRRFAANQRYDRLVADLLVAEGGGPEAGAAVYFTALQVEPDRLAASAARIFLGVQIQCAQCHDHPFDHWKQRDFWGLAAFFARVRAQEPAAMSGSMPGPRLVDVDAGEVVLPGTQEVVAPRFLDGREADAAGGRRRQLALWLASNDNPYFARATVNRVWAMLFGRGLVEPIDDLRAARSAQHARLLQELADYFVACDYDLRQLLRTVALTQAYQRSSRSNVDTGLAAVASPGEERFAAPQEAESATLGASSAAAIQLREALFAQMPVKSLSAQQLFDALTMATQLRVDDALGGESDAASESAAAARQAFLMQFGGSGEQATQYRGGIPQALSLMNGAFVQRAVQPGASGLLQAVGAPWLSSGDRVEILFLATLSRMPTTAERQQFVAYVESGGASGDRTAALGDVLWALINSAEFWLNH